MKLSDSRCAICGLLNRFHGERGNLRANRKTFFNKKAAGPRPTATWFRSRPLLDADALGAPIDAQETDLGEQGRIREPEAPRRLRLVPLIGLERFADDPPLQGLDVGAKVEAIGRLGLGLAGLAHLRRQELDTGLP